MKKSKALPKDAIPINPIINPCNKEEFILTYSVCDGEDDCNKKEDELLCMKNQLLSPSKLCNKLTYLNVNFYTKVCPYLKNVTSVPLPNRNHSDCIYILDQKNRILPLANGHHLTNCENYTCSVAYFKCPGFYCIPWQYVCNGRADCPGAMEEKGCSNPSFCAMMLKCKHSVICISHLNICDGVADCPLMDDEDICDTPVPHCPTSCLCLLFVARCNG